MIGQITEPSLLFRWLNRMSMKIILILFLLLLSLHASSETAQNLGYYSDYKEALAVAKDENKPLMLIVVTSYCPWCRKFERKSLSSEKVSLYIQKYFIPVIVDRNKDAKEFPSQYQTPRIPTVFYINPSTEYAYWETLGYLSRSDMAEALEDAKALYKKRVVQ